MAITFDALQGHFKAAKLSYLVLPDATVAVFGFEGGTGRRFLTNVTLEADGTLMQCRCNLGLYCAADHPAHAVMQAVVNELNHSRRAVKMSLDPDDGELTAWTDLVILDAVPTAAQVMAMVSLVPVAVQEAAGRFEAILATGQDPGEQEELV